jgi:hypothetical protein
MTLADDTGGTDSTAEKTGNHTHYHRPAEYVTPGLVRLLSIATQDLNRHLSDHGTCALCR